MTPVQKIKHLILIRDQDFGTAEPLPEINAENIDDVYDERSKDWALQGAMNETREGMYVTDVPSVNWSRYYESREVAAQAPDGSYVGWTYWYGGGKHGEPEAIDWMSFAYDLECVEREVTVTQRIFTKLESTGTTT